jgi:MFS family permease
MEYSGSRTFAALRHRNFRLYYTGQLISLTGSWMQSVAFSWLVLVLTNSADHTHKLRLLFITQFFLMILAAVLGVLVQLKLIRIWDLSMLVFLTGTVMAFDIPARQAFIVELVGKADLPNAIALNSTLFNATRVMGPATGGVIIAALGMANCFYLNAVSFLAVLLALALIRVPRPRPAAWTPFLRAWRELLDYLLAHQELKLILLLMTAVAILAMPYFVLLPLLARDVLGVGPRGFGLLMATSGLGAFLGGLTLARRLQRRPPMPSFLGGLATFLAGLIGLGLCGNYYLALGFIFLAGFGMVSQLSTGNSLMQLNVPDELRGRVMSLFGLIVMGFAPIGSLLYGGVAHFLGPGSTIAACSLLALACASLVFLRNPGLWHLSFTALEVPEEPTFPLNLPPFRG